MIRQGCNFFSQEFRNHLRVISCVSGREAQRFVEFLKGHCQLSQYTLLSFADKHFGALAIHVLNQAHNSSRFTQLFESEKGIAGCSLSFARMLSRCSALKAVNAKPYCVPNWRVTLAGMTTFPDADKRITIDTRSPITRCPATKAPKPLSLRSRTQPCTARFWPPRLRRIKIRDSNTWRVAMRLSKMMFYSTHRNSMCSSRATGSSIHNVSEFWTIVNPDCEFDPACWCRCGPTVGPRVASTSEGKRHSCVRARIPYPVRRLDEVDTVGSFRERVLKRHSRPPPDACSANPVMKGRHSC